MTWFHNYTRRLKRSVKKAESPEDIRIALNVIVDTLKFQLLVLRKLGAEQTCQQLSNQVGGYGQMLKKFEDCDEELLRRLLSQSLASGWEKSSIIKELEKIEHAGAEIKKTLNKVAKILEEENEEVFEEVRTKLQEATRLRDESRRRVDMRYRSRR